MRKFNKKMGRSRSGVSDIIGNLLILAITVTLFSSIMFYVANMPEPAQATFTDLQPDIKKPIQEGTDWHIWVNVTHKGGQPLKEITTGIYLFLDGAFMGELQISNGANSLGDRWETGEIWAYKLPLESASIDSLSIMVVDKDTNSIVWTSDLIGGSANIPLPPFITRRWTDPEIGFDGEDMTVYVTVIDPNKDDITSVTLNLTLLSGLETYNAFQLNQKKGNVWFDVLPIPVNRTWNSKTISINATDETGLSNQASLTIRALGVPTGGNGGSENGDDFSNFQISGLQGFAIFERSDWEKNHLRATQTTNFTRPIEDAVIVLISKLVVNTEKENTLLVMNPINKQIMQEVSSVTGNDFAFYRNVAGYYIYNCTIDTMKLPDISRKYSISAVITDTSMPTGNSLKISSEIFVKTNILDTLGNPKIITYSDSSFTVRTTSFSTFSPTNNKMYVEVQTDLTDQYILYSGNVEIRDFFWNAQISRTVASPVGGTPVQNWNGPVSNLWQVSPAPADRGPGVYRFVINLQNATEGHQWLPGNNAYVLRFDVFKTTGETHLLNLVVNVDSPTTKLDLVVGSLPSTSKNSAWSGLISLLYYSNDNSWNPPSVLISTPSKLVTNPDVKLVRAGDLNGDGRGDAVVVVYDDVTGSSTRGTYIYAFISQPNGGWLQTTIAAQLFGTGAPPSDFYLEIGNIDQDDDMDIVMTYNGRLYLYRNAGYWAVTQIDSGIPGINGIRLGDMDPPGIEGNDPKRSLDIVLANGAELRIYRNVDLIGTFNVANMIKLSGTTGDKFDYANAEQTLEGTLTSNPFNVQPYLNTRGVASTDVYEKITEQETLLTKSIVPTSKNLLDTPINTVNDDLDQLKFDDGVPYTVGYNRVASVIFGDQTDISDGFNTKNVEFIVNYYTDGYTQDNWIEWYDAVAMEWKKMMKIVDTGGTYQEFKWALTANFPTAEKLTDLKVRFVNSGTPDVDTVHFDSWKVNVTWVVGDSLDHRWTFLVTSGTPQVFSVYAAMDWLSVDGDQFKFQYSTDGNNWIDMAGVVFDSTVWSTKTYSFSPSISGIVYVRVIDTNSAENNSPNLNGLKVSQMYFKTLGSTTKIGDQIKSFDLADVNGDGSTDIVVGTFYDSDPLPNKEDYKGQIWVLYNVVNAEGGIFGGTNILKYFESAVDGELTNLGLKNTDVKWTVKAGNFFTYAGSYLDIIFSYSGGVYYVNIVDKTTFSNGVMGFLVPTSPITTMLALDIDGNRRSDLIFGTEDGRIILWSNYEGYTTSFGWQMITVDQLNNSIRTIDAATFTL